MTVEHAPWPPETRRAFKEVLYRFMGEVHATKAALYLKTTDEAWGLATQYGFHRRDRLADRYPDDDTVVRMVRAFGDDPRYYNDASELGDLREYLSEAGTSRMMLVPLTGRFVGLLGFIDVRDKGGQQPFVAADLEIARSIAAELTRLAESAEPVESIASVEPDDPAAADEGAGERAAGDDTRTPEALLDEPGLDDLNAAAAECLVDPRVGAVGLGLVTADAGAGLIHQLSGSSAVDLDPIIRHQLGALQRASAPTPQPESWKTEIRRAEGGGVALQQPLIVSSVLLKGAGSAIVASVIGDGDPAVGRRVLKSLGRRAVAARESHHLRVARRGLARRLLQPGDRRYPELVAHSLGVSRLCWSIARVLAFDAVEVENAALAGLLHDVGMRELDYDRLYMHPTPGPEDRRTYRMHVEVGERIVRVEGFDAIADAVRHHHERWDGNGYPDRLAGPAIPMLARVVHVAEVFDLFTAANSYRPAVSNERALAILDRAAGHQFDPAVVEAMSKVVE